MPSINTTIRRNDEAYLRVRPTLLGEHQNVEQDSKKPAHIKPVTNRRFHSRTNDRYIYGTDGAVRNMHKATSRRDEIRRLGGKAAYNERRFDPELWA